ncbi:MAG: glutathione S-transferase family protein [Pseudomonadota bacterium]
MLTLYSAPGTCALASHLALEHARADYKLVRLDFSRDEQRSPDYLKINPKGRVPALATEHGILTETPALLLYIAQAFPQARLAPLDDPYALAQVQEFNSYISSTVHVAHAHGRRGARWVDAGDTHALEAMKKKLPQSMGDTFLPIEAKYLRGPWVMGEQLTVCDYYLFTMALWLEGDGVDLSRLPRVMEHRARLQADPLVQRVLESQRAPA